MSARKRKMSDDAAELGAPARAGPATVGVTTGNSTFGQPHRPGADASIYHTDQYYRTLYSSEPNFKQLAKQDANFASLLKENGQLDFSDPAAVMQLTKTLLRLDFGLKIDLPEDRLCPPIPNRHNYILWLKNLMDTTSYEEPGRKLCGLDIGTGASCIYPLLGTAQRPWHFIATDIDSRSLEYARRNVKLNGLEDRIRILERKAPDALIPLDELGMHSIDFVMMNPPFYTSDDEMLSSAEKKSRPPHSACTGAPVEMVCDGGEVAYVGRMIQESLGLRGRIQWYTSMLGKVSSLVTLVDRLRLNGIDNFAVTELIQGNKTRRWALGWSFGPVRPTESVARGMKASIWKKLLPLPARMDLLVLPSGVEIRPLIQRIVEITGSLEMISWCWDSERLKGIGRVRENVWSRAWRRRKARETKEGVPADASRPGATESEQCQLGFAISVDVGISQTMASLHWLEGHDHGLFESLGGFLQGKLQGL